jgi:glutamine amidotransferase
MGNHTSVRQSLESLGFRVVISSDTKVLDGVDLLVIPGVGAFPAAMEELNSRGLVTYLREQAVAQRPILGICLGMQLLTSASSEYGHVAGLDIIPGEFVALDDKKLHVGWNALESINSSSIIHSSHGKEFYFNHSFRYDGPLEWQLAVVRSSTVFAAAIQKDSVVGIQFHPEKSQMAGKLLIKDLVMGLVND